MNLFQAIVLGLFVFLAVLTVSSSLRGNVRKRVALFWLLVWGSGAVAMIWPRTTVIVANRLGIGRGADLLLYSSVLAMLAGFFYVYTRFRKLDRQLTLLVRRLAIEHPALPEAQTVAAAKPLPGGEPLSR
jgi:hypothetical protein